MTLVCLCKRPDSENRGLSILSFIFLLIPHVGREQAAGLYYLACPKIQDIKGALALLYMGRLGIVSVHGTYVGGSTVCLGQMCRETTGGLRRQVR